jgi:hypothetical protein
MKVAVLHTPLQQSESAWHETPPLCMQQTPSAVQNVLLLPQHSPLTQQRVSPVKQQKLPQQLFEQHSLLFEHRTSPGRHAGVVLVVVEVVVVVVGVTHVPIWQICPDEQQVALL